MTIQKIAVCFALVSVAGAARAEQGIFIQSEAQFAQEYADQIKRIADGVYLFTAGELAGKVVALGDSGLEYNLKVHRAHLKERAEQGRPAGVSALIVKDLEELQQESRRAREAGSGGAATMASSSGSINCSYWDPSMGRFNFSGGAWVHASVELYRSNGGGGLNPYYARAHSDANAYLNKPWQVPAYWFLFAHTYVEDRLTGVVQSNSLEGADQVYSSAGPVYSGPVFWHDMYAYAHVTSNPNFCSGYVAISDSDPFN